MLPFRRGEYQLCGMHCSYLLNNKTCKHTIIAPSTFNIPVNVTNWIKYLCYRAASPVAPEEMQQNRAFVVLLEWTLIFYYVLEI